MSHAYNKKTTPRFLKRYRLRSLPKSFRVFIAGFLCVAGFCYLSLLGSIWLDTQMRLDLITEGYGDMGNIELVQHSLKYLLWFFGIFAFTVFVFLWSSYSEKLKIFFSATAPLMILLDVGSAWGIRYHPSFSLLMIFSGFLLAVLFLSVFLLLQYDLWRSKIKEVA